MIAFLTGVNIYKLGNYIYLICYYIITYIIIVMVSRFLNNIFINNIEEFTILDRFKLQVLIILTSILSICIYFESNRQTNVVCELGLKMDRNGGITISIFYNFFMYYISNYVNK
ncbi:hypothetical protein Q5M85_04235 [Paraclostridium bifermentans]|nr:hypothetical protein [Paraclostridium bifermentans]